MNSQQKFQAYNFINPSVEMAIDSYLVASTQPSEMPDSYFQQKAINEYFLNKLQAAEFRLKVYQIRMGRAYKLQSRLQNLVQFGTHDHN